MLESQFKVIKVCVLVLLDTLNSSSKCREFSIAKTKIEEAFMWIQKGFNND